MRTKPILFNTEMVRAILEGRKTVTRLVAKPQPNGTFGENDFGVLVFTSREKAEAALAKDTNVPDKCPNCGADMREPNK